MVDVLSVHRLVQLTISRKGVSPSVSKLVGQRFREKDLSKLLRASFIALLDDRRRSDAALEDLEGLLRESDVLLESLKAVLATCSPHDDILSDFRDHSIAERYIVALREQQVLAASHFEALHASLTLDLGRCVTELLRKALLDCWARMIAQAAEEGELPVDMLLRPTDHPLSFPHATPPAMSG